VVTLNRSRIFPRGREDWGQVLHALTTLMLTHELERDTRGAIGLGNDQPDPAYHLCSADSVLWSIGTKDIMAFEGSDWSRMA
jgi:hypothetical protein